MHSVLSVPTINFIRCGTTIVFLFLLQLGLRAGETENVILVTMDGLRWQELFGGADQRLMTKEAGDVDDEAELKQRFYRDDEIERREQLMPFFWSVVAKQGQVFGDPNQDSEVRVTNGHFFSYPGYNELLTGFGDPSIDSNDKVHNKNTTVLEWINNKPGFRGRVAAFASWDVFPYIVNQPRSGIPVNAGWQPLEVFSDANTRNTYNRLARELPRYWSSVRYDAFTARGALEYMKKEKPRLLYMALGETDDWAHAGRYDLYLDAAWKNDQYIRELWETAQDFDQYRGKTSLLITTDHGRGDGREGWKSHGTSTPGSDRMWLALIGPDTTAQGIVANAKLQQSQVAATVAMLLGFDFTDSDARIAKPIPRSAIE